MKKLFAFISVFLMLSVSIFADVSVKKLDNGKYEVTFFYGNPRAAEVVIAGDFTNWQNGAEPMTKTDKGWTYTKVVPAGTTMKYKFISDGNWTADIKAPDTIDDGFGGLNGLVDVDALAGGGAQAAGPKLKFQTWAMIGAQTKFDIQDDAANETTSGLETAGINMKAYVKVSGQALPKVPMYIEVAVAEKDDFQNLYVQGEKDIVTGLKNMGVDLVCDPISWFNGEKQAATYLGHFKWGFESDYVNWTTGYKYAKLPPHNINDWITVDKEWEAGYEQLGGFNYFELGNKLQQLPFGTLKLALAPNKCADRKGSQYGFFGWVNLNLGSVADINFQYNTALGKTFDTIFGHCYEQDFIVGYKGVFGPVTAKFNALYNLYGDGDLSRVDGVTYVSKFIPATSDVGEVVSDLSSVTQLAALANLAGVLDVNYSNDDLSATVGVEVRGKQAGMMYVEEGADEHTNISDQLGDLNHWGVYANVNGNVTSALNLGIKPELMMTLDKALKSPYNSEDTLEIKAKPYFSLDFDELMYVPAKLDGYAKLAFYTNEADAKTGVFGKSQFALKSLGLKYSMDFSNDIVKNVEVIYGFDNKDSDFLYNTVLSNWKMAKDITVQFGGAVRTKNMTSTSTIPYSPFGVYAGVCKKLSVLAKPTVYCQFMYGMDPYAKFGDGPTGYRMDPYSSYITKDGVKDYANNYAARIGLQWDL